MKLIKSTFGLIMIALAIYSCTQNTLKNQPDDNESSVNSSDKLVLDTSKQCFLAVLGKDSALLSLQLVEGKLKGNLKYHFFEKDNSNGTVEGMMFKDTLYLNYTFNAEGSTSTRPLKMLLSNQQIFEIYGNTKADAASGFIYNSANCKN
jgi:hypothetical protein